MVILCKECHEGAPNDPSYFLEYQQNGGRKTASMFRIFFQDILFDDPESTASDIWALFCENRTWIYFSSWDKRIESPLPGTKGKRGKNWMSADEARSMLYAAVDYKKEFAPKLTVE